MQMELFFTCVLPPIAPTATKLYLLPIWPLARGLISSSGLIFHVMLAISASRWKYLIERERSDVNKINLKNKNTVAHFTRLP
jgi:hypothetical protein